MGVVYRAEHQLIGKAAAVKVLLPELSTNHEIVNRFFNEAKAATAIRHPGIVEIFDFGYMADGITYIVMEFLDGEPLSRRLAARHTLDEREAVSLIRNIASALAAAHAQGIVHRDLKPDNIFLVPDPAVAGGERPKVHDFGIAKVADSMRSSDGAARTRTGVMMGTPTYMSPEQCRGAGEVDHRSDLYALGCILYEMLAGRPPFVAEGMGEIIAAHLVTPPDPPSRLNPGVSADLEHLTLCLLAKRPEDRVQSAAELARLLGEGSMPPMSAAFSAQTVAVRIPTSPQRTPLPGLSGLTPPPTQVLQQPTTLGGAAAEASTTLAPRSGPRRACCLRAWVPCRGWCHRSRADDARWRRCALLEVRAAGRPGQPRDAGGTHRRAARSSGARCRHHRAQPCHRRGRRARGGRESARRRAEATTPRSSPSTQAEAAGHQT